MTDFIKEQLDSLLDKNLSTIVNQAVVYLYNDLEIIESKDMDRIVDNPFKTLECYNHYKQKDYDFLIEHFEYLCFLQLREQDKILYDKFLKDTKSFRKKYFPRLLKKDLNCLKKAFAASAFKSVLKINEYDEQKKEKYVIKNKKETDYVYIN